MDVCSHERRRAPLDKVAVDVEFGSPRSHRRHTLDHGLSHGGGGFHTVALNQCVGTSGKEGRHPAAIATGRSKPRNLFVENQNLRRGGLLNQ